MIADAPPTNLLDEVHLARRIPTPAMRRAIREAAGVSQDRLARELGVQRVTVTRWELGIRRPRGVNAVRYVNLLSRIQIELAGAA